MTATISQTGRKIEAAGLKQGTAEWCPDKIEVPTGLASLGTRLRHYRNVLTNWMVVAGPTRTMTNVARECAAASSG